ncbi:MAG: hypothetical protein ACTSWA_08755, partial [Candidatus Thorarchaeota archaeon]
MKIPENLISTFETVFSDNNKWRLSLGVLLLWWVSFIFNVPVVAYYLVVPIFFFLIGGLIRLGVLSRVGWSLESKNFFEISVIDVLLSIIVTSIISVTLGILFILDSLIVVIAFSGIFLFAISICAITPGESDSEVSTKSAQSIEYRYAILGIIVFGIIFSLIRLVAYPWPTTAGTDTFSHLAVINQIIHDQGTDHILASYPFIFHTIVATLSLLSGANPLFVISNIYPFVYPFSLLLSFLLIFYITKNEAIAFLSTILTLSVYEHGGYLATYLPFPSSIAFIFLYTSFVACFILPSSKFSITFIVALVALTILMYPSAIFVAIPLITYLLVKQGHLTERFSFLYKTIFGGIIIGGLSLILLFYILFPLAMISIPEIQIVSIIVITNNLDGALLHFTYGYSILQAIAIICGIAISWIKVRGFKRFQLPSLADMNFGVIALMGTAYFIVLFSPMRYTHRTELYLRPFYMLLIVLMAYIASMAITDLLRLGDRFPGRKSLAIV